MGIRCYSVFGFFLFLGVYFYYSIRAGMASSGDPSTSRTAATAEAGGGAPASKPRLIVKLSKRQQPEEEEPESSEAEISDSDEEEGGQKPRVKLKIKGTAAKQAEGEPSDASHSCMAVPCLSHSVVPKFTLVITPWHHVTCVKLSIYICHFWVMSLLVALSSIPPKSLVSISMMGVTLCNCKALQVYRYKQQEICMLVITH